MKKKDSLGKQRGSLIPPNIRHKDERKKTRSQEKQEWKKDIDSQK